MRCPVLSWRICYAVSGTELAYGVTGRMTTAEPRRPESALPRGVLTVYHGGTSLRKRVVLTLEFGGTSLRKWIVGQMMWVDDEQMNLVLPFSIPLRLPYAMSGTHIADAGTDTERLQPCTLSPYAISST
eukprot:74255-Rhodomonas_salina.2